MALLTEDDLYLFASRLRRRTGKDTSILLRESRDTTQKQFDAFLSHSSMDKNLVLGAKAFLEDRGYSVYVDWIDDPLLVRSKVSVKTAAILRERMKQCKSMIYAHTKNASLSKWCPWELGYFDGMRKGNVFILPIVKENLQTNFKGQEYLGLYPYLDKAKPKGDPDDALWVNGIGRDYQLKKVLDSPVGINEYVR